ncbi:reverse transcriptase [Cucumis melo var. makuwa]|uniref:Reverse transcriptase n=1 Tax=Cucumis melo var. makuwa TaxID=1194695 RepID=A0A5A7UCV6_CUCMM|nr:reverse transcriptase [Cucumis melo var. makuwa]TYK01870.1 reverse transcriptase [Cucumis melo var. makuwa]
MSDVILFAARLINRMSWLISYSPSPNSSRGLKKFYPATQLIPNIPLWVVSPTPERLEVFSPIFLKVTCVRECYLPGKQILFSRWSSLRGEHKPGSYDPSLDMPIALRKGTRSCMKHSMCNYISYSSLSPTFKAFTKSLDAATIPKNIYKAMESPKWKAVFMEEIGALEKNKT